MFNEDHITLFNSCRDGSYRRTYIKNVDLQIKQSVAFSVTEKGLLSADMVKIFIDKPYDAEGKKYLKHKEYQRSSKDKFFTFKEGDIIVKNIIDFNLIPSDRNSNKKYLDDYYDDVYTVISIIEFDDHFEIGCK